LTPGYAALAIAFLLCALAACSSVPRNDGMDPPPFSATDQDFIASRHGGM